MARPVLSLAVRRVLTTLEVGGVRLRSLGSAALSATGTLAASVVKATTHTAPLVASATLAAAVALRREVSAPFAATGTLAAFVAKATAHTAPLDLLAALAVGGIQKTTTHAAPLATAAAFAARLDLSGRSLITSGGNRLIFSNTNGIATVTRTL
jgi:hypothetical protein